MTSAGQLIFAITGMTEESREEARAAIQQTTTIKIGSISVNHCQDIFLNISQQTKTGTNPHLADSLTRPSHNSIFRVRGIPKYLVWWLTAESLWFYSFMTLINYPYDWAFVTGTWRVPAKCQPLQASLPSLIFTLMLNMLKLSTCVNILTATRGSIFADVTC